MLNNIIKLNNKDKTSKVGDVRDIKSYCIICPPQLVLH